MVARVYSSAEGTNAATVTTGNSNFNTVTSTGTGTTVTYDNTHAHSGSTSIKLASGTGSPNASLKYTTTGFAPAGKTVYGRAYFYFTGTVGATTSIFYIGDGTTRISELRLSSTANQLRIERSAGTAALSPTDTITVNNQWIRVEWKVFSDATVGTVDVKIFQTADSITPTYTYSVTNEALLGNNPTEFFVGVVNSANSITYWVDDVAWSDTDWLGPVDYTQTSFRGRNDDGSETTATWKATANTNFNMIQDINFRIRFLVDANGLESTDWQGFYNKNGAGWNAITGSSSNVKAVTTSNYSEGDATTQQIGSGSFVAGTMDKSDAFYGSTSFTTFQQTELEGNYQIVGTDTTPGDTIQIRMQRGNFSAFGTYSNTPTVTVVTSAVTKTTNLLWDVRGTQDFAQTKFRGRNDDGTQTTATWIAAANINWTQFPDVPFRVRFLVSAASTAQTDWQAFYSRNGGTWTAVTGSSSVVKAVASTGGLTDNIATTQQLGSGTFVAGSTDTTDGYYGLVPLNTGQESEFEGCYQIIKTDTSPGDSIQLRMQKGNFDALETYTFTPSLTVGNTVVISQTSLVWDDNAIIIATNRELWNIATATGAPVVITNSFIGTNGVGITAANSGFDSISTIAGDASFNYDSDGYVGTAGHIITGAGSNIYGRYDISFVPNGATIYGRAYIKFSANPTASPSLMGIFNASIQRMVDIRVATTGKIYALDSTNAVALQTVNSIALNQYVRIEWKAILSATVGQVEIKIFNTPDSTTATEIITSGATLNLRGTDPAVFLCGITNSAASNNFLVDEIGWSDTSYLGPVGTTTTPVTSATQLPWNINSVTGNSLNVLWNIPGAVTSATQVPWDIFTTVTTVTRSLPWDVLISVNQSVIFLWNDLQLAAQSNTLLWDVLSNNPPMLRVGNTFAGTNGTSLAAASCGLASGIPIDAVSVPVNSSLTLDNAHAHSGSTSVKVANTASANVWFRYQQMFRIPGSVDYGRLYFYLEGNPAASTTLVQISDTNGAMFSIRVNTSGKVQIWDSTGSLISGTSASVSLNQWVRIEWKAVYSATVGQVEIKLFNSPESTSPTETLTSSASLNLRSTSPVYHLFGIANGASGVTYWLDDVALSVTNYPGPSGGFVLSREVGAVTSTSATVAGKVINATSVRTKFSTAVDLSTSPIFSSSTGLDSNGAFQCQVTGLSANTKYYYGIECDGTIDTDSKGSVRTFKISGSLNFAAASCQYNLVDDSLMDLIQSYQPEFFQHLGDLGYRDPVLNTIDENQKNLDEYLNNIRYQNLFANIPFSYIWSDHDSVGNNGDGSSPSLPAYQAGYRSRFPHYTLPDSLNKGVYFSFTRQLDNHLLYFIATDDRSYASPKTDTDNASKTKLGTEQKAWLKAKCLESKAAGCPVIVLFLDDAWSNGPHSGGDNIPRTFSGDDTWEAYTTERGELIQFFKDNNLFVYIIHGDLHALAADNGTNTPGNIPVAVCSPLNNTTYVGNATYSQGYYPNPVSTIVMSQQFGYFTVTDTSTSVSITFSGKDIINSERVAMSTTFTLPTPVEKPISLLWNDLGTVNQPISLPWDIRGLVTLTTRSLWDVASLAVKGTSSLWDISGQPTKTIAIPWDVLTNTTAETTVPWDIFTSVTPKTYSLLWDIQALTTITAPTILKWNVLVGLSTNRILSWDLFSTVAQNFNILWDERAIAVSPIDIIWNINAIVTTPTILLWNNLAIIVANRSIPWDINSIIESDTVVKWNILDEGGVLSTTALLWDNRGAVGKTTRLIWTLAGSTTRESRLVWDILYKSSITKTMMRNKIVYAETSTQMAARD